MSHDAVKWALTRQCTSTQKFVLVALANCLNSVDNRCDPSIGTISHVTGFSARCIQKAIAELASIGLLTPIRRPQRSTAFTLHQDRNVAPQSPRKTTHESDEEAASETSVPTAQPNQVLLSSELPEGSGERRDTNPRTSIHLPLQDVHHRPNDVHPNKEENKEEIKESEVREQHLFNTWSPGTVATTPSATRTADKRPVKAEKVGVPIPDWVPVGPWNAYLEMRKAKKAPATPGAIAKTISDLSKYRDEGHDPGEVLMRSVQRAWVGVFAINDRSSGRGGFEKRTMAGDLQELRRRQGYSPDLVRS